MDRVKHLIAEAHRRSLWQVLGVYLVTSWAVVEVVETLTGVWGLPGWVPHFAFVLLLIGLPVVLATAVVQKGAPGRTVGSRMARGASEMGPGVEGNEEALVGGSADGALEEGSGGGGSPRPIPPPSPERSFLQRQLTWKRALMGGGAAFAFLALLVGGYFASWAMGIGPVGSLLATGELEEGDWIVVADFEGPAADPDLGMVVAEALRIDLGEHPSVRVADGAQVQAVLERMQADHDGPLTAELAREVAIREGMAAVLDGEVAQVGPGYVLTATLRSAGSGEGLFRLRENAAHAEELIPVMGRLSERIRERSGESLRSIRAGPELEEVTTSSLPALRLFSDAIQANGRGERDRAIRLIEEATDVDPDFAMAWNTLAIWRANAGLHRSQIREAADRAYELRSRLSARERLKIEGDYHLRWGPEQDWQAAEDAFSRLLEIDPDHASALNNLAFLRGHQYELDDVMELQQRAVELPGRGSTTVLNLIIYSLAAGRVAEARETLERFLEEYPDHPGVADIRARVRFHEGDDAGARRILETALLEGDPVPATRSTFQRNLAVLSLWRGRIGEAREQFTAAERTAAGVAARLRWLRRSNAAAAEILLGDIDRGAAMLLDGSDEWVVHGPASRFRAFYVFALGWAGRSMEAESWLDAWRDAVPPEERGVGDEADMDAARAVILVGQARSPEAVEILELMRSSMRCSRCYAWTMGWALREAGRLEEAVEEWEWSSTPAETWANYLYPLFHLWLTQELAPLYEELGDAERALHHYRRLVELWQDADPELQPRVEHARERIAALEGSSEGGPGDGPR